MAELKKFDFQQGFNRETTQYAEEGRWFDGNRVRFRAGRPENLRGYQTRALGSTFDGSARDLITWSDSAGTSRIVFGTPDKLYEQDGDQLYDITPIVTAVTLANCFGTSSGQTRVCCSDANHGAQLGDYVLFTSSAAFNAVSLQGKVFPIASIASANVFTIEVTGAADATGSDAGSATFNYYIPTGFSVLAGGFGYGTAKYQATVCASQTRAWNQPASAGSSGITFNVTQWSLDNWGEDIIANRSGSNIFYWDSDSSTIPGEVHATSITTSPISVNSILVSPNDRHLIAFGTNEYSATATVSGTFNPMLVRWSDQDNKSNWVPAADTTAGEVVLTDGTEIVGAKRSKNAINIWTDNSLWTMAFAGPPFTFRFTQAGSNCGLVGPHAGIDFNGVTYWMGFGNFHRFSGQVETVPCTVRRYVFDDINVNYYTKVYAGTNSEFNEIIWLYPSGNKTECDKYVIYNPVDNYWVYGSMFFTTFNDKEVFGNTITTGVTAAGNNVYNNEPVSVFVGADNETLDSFVESADFDIADGNSIMFMNRIIPDYEMANGGKIKMKITTQQFPESSQEVTKEFDITNATEKVDFRSRGRQAKVRVSCDSNGTSWRWGSLRLALQGDGRR
jgi:hypothetical protein|tara:strand:- start:800 stop:2650 length:1851 start_codon:yes stop_codon:yes gene_type:complete